MFCSKCGRQIPDGSVCPCQQEAQQPQYQAPQQPQYQQAPAPRTPINKKALFPVFTLDKVSFILVSILVFGIQFTNWYKAVSEYEGTVYGREFFGPYYYFGDMSLGDINGLMVVVQIMLIVSIIVFAAFLFTSIINLGAIVPALSRINLNKILALSYYGILVICLFLGFIAAVTGEYSEVVHLAGGWWLTLIHTVVGFAFIFRSNIVSTIVNKVKALNA